MLFRSFFFFFFFLLFFTLFFWLIGVCQLRIESHWCWNVVNGSATMFNIKY